MNPETPCQKCGFNLGLHRTSDEACPVPGTFINGDNARWCLDSTFTAKLPVCTNCGFPANVHRPSDQACPIKYQSLPGRTPTVLGYAETKFEPLEDFKILNPGGTAPMYFREPALASSRANFRKVVFGRYATVEERRARGGMNFKTEGIQGFFHCFGSSYEEFEAGPGNYSTAIVEDMSGQVFEIFPSDMKFLS